MGPLGISRIKQNLSIQLLSSGNGIYSTTPNKLMKLLKDNDAEKTVGLEMIPPKLVKKASYVLSSS